MIAHFLLAIPHDHVNVFGSHHLQRILQHVLHDRIVAQLFQHQRVAFRGRRVFAAGKNHGLQRLELSIEIIHDEATRSITC